MDHGVKLKRRPVTCGSVAFRGEYGRAASAPSRSWLQPDYLIGQVLTDPGTSLTFRLMDDDTATSPPGVDSTLLQESNSPLSNAFAAAYIRVTQLPADINQKHASFNRNTDARSRAIAAMPHSRFSMTFELVETARQRRTSITGSATYRARFSRAKPGTVIPIARVPLWSKGARNHRRGNHKRTREPLYGSQVYVEPTAESDLGGAKRCSEVVPVHELGHQFGVADGLDTEGFMSRPCDKAGRYFAPASIRRLRENGVRP
jgi:hypothetical protein